MAPAPAKPAPLPLAPDRAALSNRISMLLADRSSVLKTMNLGTAPARRTNARRATEDDDNDDDDDNSWMRGARPNQGVGYEPEGTAADKDVARQDKMLRGKILGKRAAEQKMKKFEVHSESEEEAGRSALGKRKRPRREREGVRDEEQQEDLDGPEQNTEPQTEEPVGKEQEVPKVPDGDSINTEEVEKVKKKKKKKNKKKKSQSAGTSEADSKA